MYLALLCKSVRSFNCHSYSFKLLMCKYLNVISQLFIFIFQNVFAIVDIYGKVEGITITSTTFTENPRPVVLPVSESNDSMEVGFT